VQNARGCQQSKAEFNRIKLFKAKNTRFSAKSKKRAMRLGPIPGVVLAAAKKAISLSPAGRRFFR
jgi:hypothetical protein